MKIFIAHILILIALVACAQKNKNMENKTTKPTDIFSEKELKEKLSSDQYYICIGKGTERPFTGKYWDHHDDGMYVCAVCEEPLFDSNTKFDSGSGWPSYYAPVDNSKIKEDTDLSYGMKRVEIMCKKCGSHLGHVFPDGPKPTGLRYCVNSASLNFVKRNK